MWSCGSTMMSVVRFSANSACSGCRTTIRSPSTLISKGRNGRLFKAASRLTSFIAPNVSSAYRRSKVAAVRAGVGQGQAAEQRQESSPRREPWVRRQEAGSPPAGAKESGLGNCRCSAAWPSEDPLPHGSRRGLLSDRHSVAWRRTCANLQKLRCALRRHHAIKPARRIARRRIAENRRRPQVRERDQIHPIARGQSLRRFDPIRPAELAAHRRAARAARHRSAALRRFGGRKPRAARRVREGHSARSASGSTWRFMRRETGTLRKRVGAPITCRC